MIERSGAGRPTTLLVNPSIYGLPGIGFGGYVAGALAVAAGVEGAAKVSFHAPTPLGLVLAVQLADRATTLSDGDTVLAQLEPAPSPAAPPRLPQWTEALEGSAEFLDGPEITHPDCFGCGPARSSATGLRVFTGVTSRRDVVIAAWTPPEHMCPSGELPSELLWAALDCPGAWARRRLASRDRPAVTASLTVDVRHAVRAGDRVMVIGWFIHGDGRKAWVGSSVIAADGRVHATAEALWIDTRNPQAGAVSASAAGAVERDSNAPASTRRHDDLDRPD